MTILLNLIKENKMDIEQADLYILKMTQAELRMTKAIMCKFIIRDDTSESLKNHAAALVELLEHHTGG